MAEPARKHILVVDDEPAIVTTYTAILKQAGYTVSSAMSGGEALIKLGEEPVDLPLCDMSLQGEHVGLELVAAARARNPGIACIILTGYPDDDLQAEAERLQARLLFKPATVPDLLKTLESLLAD